jgi:hypothetical protein
VGAGSGRHHLSGAQLATPATKGAPCRPGAILDKFVYWESGRTSGVTQIHRNHRVRGYARLSIGVSGNGGKTFKSGKDEDDWGLRATERPLYFRLRSAQLVHDVHLRERSIDRGTVLALLPAKRLVPRPALLKSNLLGALFNARLRRSS